MPKYQYTGKDLNNKVVRSKIEARDEADLKKRLRDEQLVLLSHKELLEKRSGYRLKANEVSEFSRQIASMLESGISVIRAIGIIKDRDFKPPLLLIFNNLFRDVQAGYTLSEAMRMQGRAFPELLINMYAAGEASGQLERSAQKMATFYEKEYRLNGKIRAAMTYPIILLGFTIVVVMLIFVFILPEFFSLFEDIEIPALTQVVIAMSKFLQTKWYYVIIGALILIALVRLLLSKPSVALVVDRLKLKIPNFGNLLKIIYTARFSRTLSSLYSSGLTMLNALSISSKILGNSYIESQFDEVIQAVRNGEPLSESIDKVIGFDKKLSTSILIGEESGRLDSMLNSVAENFDYEADMATQKLIALLEPVMIVFMAVVVGGIMLSVMQPIMTLYQGVGG